MQEQVRTRQEEMDTHPRTSQALRLAHITIFNYSSLPSSLLTFKSSWYDGKRGLGSMIIRAGRGGAIERGVSSRRWKRLLFLRPRITPHFSFFPLLGRLVLPISKFLMTLVCLKIMQDNSRTCFLLPGVVVTSERIVLLTTYQ